MPEATVVGPAIVALGGGHGLAVALRAAREYAAIAKSLGLDRAEALSIVRAAIG